jgi:hypothetical protein
VTKIIPARGHALIHGRSGSYQSNLACDLACQAALRDQVILLCDNDREAGYVAETALAWRVARSIPVGQRLRVHGISIQGERLDAKSLGRHIATRLPDGAGFPVLIVRDLSLGLQPLDAGDPWLLAAHDLAAAFDCAVLTVGHSMASLDVKAIPADVIWQATTYHDVKRQSSLNVRLTKQKPLAGETVSFHGFEAHRIIYFNQQPATEEVI